LDSGLLRIILHTRAIRSGLGVVFLALDACALKLGECVVHEPSVAALVLAMYVAVDNLLLRQVDTCCIRIEPIFDVPACLKRADGGECPARAALLLVFHGIDHALLSPVDRVGGVATPDVGFALIFVPELVRVRCIASLQSDELAVGHVGLLVHGQTHVAADSLVSRVGLRDFLEVLLEGGDSEVGHVRPVLLLVLHFGLLGPVRLKFLGVVGLWDPSTQNN